MTPKEFHEKVCDLFGEASSGKMPYSERMQILGTAQYALFALNLSIAESIREDNENKNKPGETKTDKPDPPVIPGDFFSA